MKKTKIYGLVGVAALAAVGGTFAYYTATSDFNNQFNTTNYSTSTTEKFNPNGDNKDWKPGVTVEKKVYATNTGDGDVWVRIKFDEAWTRGEEEMPAFSTADGLEIFGVAGKTEIKKGDSSAHQKSGDDYDTDGEVKDDSGSVVLKTLAGNWAENWYFSSSDGYFYYKTALKKGEVTPLLLEEVTLCDDTDMGYFETPEYYAVVEKDSFGETEVPTFPEAEWAKDKEAKEIKVEEDGITVTWKQGTPDMDDDSLKDKDVYTYQGNILDSEKLGYANADYALDITVEFLQTNEDGSIAIDSENWDEDIVNKLIGKSDSEAETESEVTE